MIFLVEPTLFHARFGRPAGPQGTPSIAHSSVNSCAASRCAHLVNGVPTGSRGDGPGRATACW